MCHSLIRQIAGGDVSAKNIWLAESVLDIFTDYRLSIVLLVESLKLQGLGLKVWAELPQITVEDVATRDWEGLGHGDTVRCKM